MNGVYDYYKDYCTCPPRRLYIGMRTRSGLETSSYPVTVYNVNNVSIGTANDKAEYIAIWNNNPANAIIGTLYGFTGPFQFYLKVNQGQTPPAYVLGDYGGGVSNVLPTANAGADVNVQLPTSSATLTGTGNDPDGTIVSYLWTKISGPGGGAITSPNTASTGITGLQAGNYVYKLLVTDNSGGTGEDTVIVSVAAATFAFSVQPISQAVAEGESYTLSATVVNGVNPMVFRWKNLTTSSITTNSGTNNTRTDSVTFTAGASTVQYEVEVEDNTGAKITSSIATITVTPALITVTFFHGSADPWTDNSTAPTMANTSTVNIAHNATMSKTFASDVPGVDFIGLRFANTEPNRATWNNGTALGSGVIPGQEFRQYTLGAWTYVISRDVMQFDSTQPLNFVP